MVCVRVSLCERESKEGRRLVKNLLRENTQSALNVHSNLFHTLPKTLNLHYEHLILWEILVPQTMWFCSLMMRQMC